MKIKEILSTASHIIPDGMYVWLRYTMIMKKPLHLKHPQTFNEKLQWLKLNYHNPAHAEMVDKYTAKEYFSRTIGNKYVIPLLSVWDKVEDIDYDSLPDKFVLKTTHDSGGLVICSDKSKLDINKANTILKKAYERNYYYHSREWPYKNLKPRIIAEQYMVDESGTELKDYKIFNFNGEPYCIQVDFNRFSGHKKNLYDTEWNLLEFSFNYPAHHEITITKPENLDEMLRLARILSKGEPYMRTDFYSINGRTYIGEVTFFPASGFGKFVPEKYDRILGDQMVLPEKQR